MRRLLQRLGSEPLVADGGMGSLLSSLLPRARCPEEANLSAPERVLELHLGFIAAGADLLVAGSIGPLGSSRLELPPARVRALFAEQALELESRGVDLFILETFTSLEELRLALAGVREAAG